MIWEVRQPAKLGNCTVRISPGLEKQDNFTVLYPKDIPTDKTGNFPCGRIKGFETQMFELPEDYVCDQCIIQWAWETQYGTHYSCSDIVINGLTIENCITRCQNGGACFNGKCICVDNYYGEFCQYDSNIYINIGFETGKPFVWICLILLVIIIIGIIIYYVATTKV
jgi:hypothetical protein